VIQVQGQEVSQEIEGLYVLFTCKFLKDNHYHTDIIEEIHLNEHFVIEPHKTKEIEFSFLIPKNITPSISEEISYYFKTGLDIDNALDPIDIDYVRILPPNSNEISTEQIPFSSN
jgi:sporulation-control protein